MPSIKDVAEEAGVSTATVSRALSGKPNVSSELRSRVQAAVEKLAYRPNLVARSLRSQQSNTIGLIVSDVRNPYFTDVSRAVEDSAYERGYSVFLCNTDEDPQKEIIYLREMRDKNVAGVIFSPTRQTAENFAALDVDLPMTVIDRTVRDGDVDSVVLGNEDAAYRLTQHLIANGYSHLAGVFGEASTTGLERRVGFERALKESGLDPSRVVYTSPKIASGYAATMKLLGAGQPLDGLLTSDSLLTAGALQALREAGRAVPDDMALVGFDDTTWATLVQPAITVIAQPTDEIGRTAVEMLMQRIENRERTPRQVILKGILLARGSSAPRQKHSA